MSVLVLFLWDGIRSYLTSIVNPTLMTNSKPKILKTSTSPPARHHDKDILIYILRVLNLAEDSLYVQIPNIEGREDITSFLEISEYDIDDLEYFKIGTPTIASKFQRSCVKEFFGYISYRNIQKNPIGVDWTSVTIYELNEYRVSYRFRCHLVKILPPGLQSYPATQMNPD